MASAERIAEHRSAGIAIARLDVLAAAAIERASPLRIGVAEAEEERRAVYRLRGECVIDNGWALSESLPAGLEYDEYDTGAVHVTASADGTLVGTCRLVFPEPGRLLPTEATFGIEIEPRAEVVNCDRLLVAPGHRGLVTARAVLGRAWLFTRERGFRFGAGTATPAAAQIFRALGLHVTVLAGPRRLWGEERYAIRTSPMERD